MDYRQLGQTSMQVSPVAYGTAPLGGLFGPVSFTDARNTVRRAIDLGINFIDTSPYYGDAEEKLGILSTDIPDDVLVGTKAGRYGVDTFDFSPARIRASLDESLRRLRRDHVDVLQLHDIDFVELDSLLTDSFAELQSLKAEGKVRAIGMTCYSVQALHRVVNETDVDVILNFAHGTLLDDSLSEVLAPIARERVIGVINAAAVSVGLLTPKILDLNPDRTENTAVAPIAVQKIAQTMAETVHSAGKNVAFLANQYALQRVDCDTTVIGTKRIDHLEEAVTAVSAPIDDQLLSEVLAFRMPAREGQWDIGLESNQQWNWS